MNSKKIEQFIKRNRKRNKQLYDSNMQEGIDFVVCPVSKERLRMIKSSYIEKILGMSVEQYESLYPGIQKSCEARSTLIKKGLHEIDPTTGKSKYQIAQEQSVLTLSTLDKNGVSGYKKLGQKTRRSHLANIDEYGRNGYSQLATRAIVKGNATKAKRGLILDPNTRNKYYRYKSVVLYVTNREKNKLPKNIKFGRAGTPNAYQIDHMFSIMHGYKQRVSPILIGHIHNLQVLPWKENLSKHSASSISLSMLIAEANYTIEQSNDEFEYFVYVIEKDMKSAQPVSGARLMEKYYESNIYKKY